MGPHGPSTCSEGSCDAPDLHLREPLSRGGPPDRLPAGCRRAADRVPPAGRSRPGGRGARPHRLPCLPDGGGRRATGRGRGEDDADVRGGVWGMTEDRLPPPYYADGWVTLYRGDCRNIVPALGGQVDLVLTDPPYGIAWDTDGRSRGGRYFPAIAGDDEPFDPTWLLRRFPRLILFGANHYADRLPASPSWVVWDKRVTMASNAQADCELAWTNLGGPARMYRQLWNGAGGRRKDHPSARRGEPVEFPSNSEATRADAVADRAVQPTRRADPRPL